MANRKKYIGKTSDKFYRIAKLVKIVLYVLDKLLELIGKFR